MNGSLAGPMIVAAGVIITIVGALMWAGGLNWFGHLPGDIAIKGERVRFYFPLASGLLVSVVLSLIMYVLRRLL